ncbi:MAG TPA: hypothetical protein PKD74_03215 [Candidatus Dependentiae bacterium]|nr:hypothetical protein [Candidatus Dependentiae bacterium]
MKHRIVYLSIATIITSSTYTHTPISQKPAPDIRHPGPDNANFTASSFTLPKGRCYVETFPLWAQITECPTEKTYYCSYLIRVGLTDYMELRLFGNGLTHIENNSSRAITGFSPFNAGLKIHLWGERDTHWIPSAGLELDIVTPLASKDVNLSTPIGGGFVSPL